MALFAKGTGLPSKAIGDWVKLPLPQTAPLTPLQLSWFEAGAVNDIARALASVYADPFLSAYKKSYAPDQRVIGITWLVWLTHFFPDLPEVKLIVGKVDALLLQIVDEIFYSDGGAHEQSFNYSDDSVVAIARLARLSGRTWSRKLSTTVRDYWRVAAGIANPFGGRPAMNVSGWGNSPERLPVATPKFAQNSLAFPFSGYYVQRKGWQKDDAYLFHFVRRNAAGHFFKASNSLQIASLGRPLISASARGSFPGYPNANAYLAEESTTRSSTIVVDGAFQKNGASVPAVEPLPGRWATGEFFDISEGTHDGDYSTASPTGVVHRRQVVFVRDLGAWVVVDRLQLTKGGSHAIRQIWKLAPPIPQSADGLKPSSGTQISGFYSDQIVVAASGPRALYTTDTAPDAVNLSIYQVSSQVMTRTKYFGSTDGSSLYGYDASTNSAVAGAPSFACDLHVEWAGTTDSVIISIIVPFKGISDGVTSQIDSSNSSTAALDLSIDGKLLSVRASTTLTTLSALGPTVNACDLLVVESESGANPRVLVLGEAGSAGASYMSDRNAILAIDAPTGFRWTESATGVLTASYSG